jgi:hypothetical protein
VEDSLELFAQAIPKTPRLLLAMRASQQG